MLGARIKKCKQSLMFYGNQEHSLDHEKIKNLRIELLGNHQDKIIFLSIGRICSWKGQLNVLKALNIIKDKEITNKIHLLIVGSPNSKSDHQYAHEIQNFYQKNLKDHHLVSFIEHSPNPHHFMQACDVLIHSSTIPEPFGLVVSEAMMNQCLVLGSSQGGVRDILIDNQTGITYDSTSDIASELLADKILKTIELIENDQNHQIRKNA